MTSERRLDGTSALVTGASAGIGAASARELAASGANVALLARSEDELERVATEIESEWDVCAIPVPADVREYEQVTAAVDEAVSEFGGLDTVVSNAGVTGDGFEERLEEMDLENYYRVMEVNTNGMFHVAHAALAHLRASNGTLVFIGSSAGKLPRPGAPVYAASKWWTRGFALSVQAHAGQDGVAVSLINPTAVRTGIWKDELQPGEAAEPEEVASVVGSAARQESHTTLSEVDLFRRDMLGKFIPAELDLDLAYDRDSE